MRAHKTQKGANKAPKERLHFGFWGEPVRWSRGEQKRKPSPASSIRRNEGLGSGGIRDRQTTTDVSWSTDEADS